MIWLLDNDLIKKLAICDLLEEALAALPATHNEVFVLPTARYVLLKPKKPAEAKARLGEAAFERLSGFLERVQNLAVQPSQEEQQILDDIVGIDSGEAILFSASAHFPEFGLGTGDKNSLRALQASPTCQAICDRLKGRILCFEQVVVRMIAHDGFEAVRAKAVPASSCDTALRAVFGSGLEATESNVQRGLASYIADLRRDTGALLFSE